MKIFAVDYMDRKRELKDIQAAVEWIAEPNGLVTGELECLRDRVDNLTGLIARLIKHSSLTKHQLSEVLGPEFEVECQ